MSAAAQKSMAEFRAKVIAKVPSALDVLALTLKSQIQHQLSKPGTGRLYRVRNKQQRVLIAGPLLAGQTRNRFLRLAKKRTTNRPSDFHRASAPNNPPAPDTNALKRSAYVEKEGVFKRLVGVATKYAALLNFGTARIAPRPFMQPAFDETTRVATDTMTKALIVGPFVQSRRPQSVR